MAHKRRALLDAHDVIDNAIRSFPLTGIKRTSHIVIPNKVDQNEPSRNVRFTKEVKMRKTIRILVKSVGPFRLWSGSQ